MWGNATLFCWKKFYWKTVEKNIENWENLFDRLADHSYAIYRDWLILRVPVAKIFLEKIPLKY